MQTVLIIEDEAIIAMALAADLEDAGYRVADICPRGDEAIALLQQQTVDVVILDVKLGNSMDGLETLKEIRNIGNPKIIIVSGNSDAATAQKIKDEKVDGFFVKPLNTKNLLLHLKNLD